MGKYCTMIVLSALCLLTIAGLGDCAMSFDVKGKVYCDNCRVLFPTRLSPDIADVEVELKCKSRDNDTITYKQKAKTAKDGYYKMNVPNDHENEICEVTVVSVPDSNCNEITSEISIGRVPLDHNSGIENKGRFVNPIGVRATKAANDCIKVLKELGFVPLDQIKDD